MPKERFLVEGGNSFAETENRKRGFQLITSDKRTVQTDLSRDVTVKLASNSNPKRSLLANSNYTYISSYFYLTDLSFS
jgi:hypothetical protein